MRNSNTKTSKIILNSNEDKYSEVEWLIKFTSSNINKEEEHKRKSKEEIKNNILNKLSISPL